MRKVCLRSMPSHCPKVLRSYNLESRETRLIRDKRRGLASLATEIEQSARIAQSEHERDVRRRLRRGFQLQMVGVKPGETA